MLDFNISYALETCIVAICMAFSHEVGISRRAWLCVESNCVTSESVGPKHLAELHADRGFVI